MCLHRISDFSPKIFRKIIWWSEKSSVHLQHNQSNSGANIRKMCLPNIINRVKNEKKYIQKDL